MDQDQTPDEFLFNRIRDLRRKCSALPFGLYEAIDIVLTNQEAIIKMYKEWPVLVSTEPELEQLDGETLDFGFHYRMTQQIQWLTVQEYRKKFGTEPPLGKIIQEMLVAYRDHPYFDPAWIGE